LGIKIRHDLGSWITPVQQLEKIIKLAPKKKLIEAKNRGYIDIQMLWETFGKVPTFSFGTGEPGTAHQADEYVQVSSLKKAEKFFIDLLNLK
jgi:acetylornithine deacetylase/succinyl-diaminopimelate desuccinylase-like protein